MTNKMKQKLNEYKEFLENKGYEVLHIGLYGSQNYNLHDDTSDFDARAIVLLPFNDLLKKKNLSKTYDMGDDGLIDVKDVMGYYDVIRKGNPSFIEPITTDFWVGDPVFRSLLLDAEVNPKALVGMCMQKRAGIAKGLPHNSPTIEKLGYDTKQLLHTIRLTYLLEELYEKGSLKQSHVYYDNNSTIRKELLELKQGLIGPKSKEEALELADEHIERAKEIEAKLPKFEGLNNEEKLLNYLKAKYKEVLLKQI